MKTVKDVVAVAFLASLLTVGKLALFGIPNIEVVSLLVILYAARMGWLKSLLITIIFATVEVMIWGFGIWTFGYYLFWPLLVFLTTIMPQRWQNQSGYTILSGLFGLSFGLLFAIYSAPLTNLPILVYWLNGITFDIVHMIGNVFVMLLLYHPVNRALSYISSRMSI
jgi:hypothetical protein